MRDQDIELIAALVEGRLEDETEARALIDSSSEHRDEYEAQKLAYDALQGAGTTSLSEAESSALRRDIWTDLRSGAGVPSARSPWYYRWAPVAAGLFVVIGLVTVLTQVTDGGDAVMETAADLASSATTAADGAEADEDVAPTSTATAMDDAEGDGESAPAFTEESGDADDGGDAASTALYAEEAARIREGDLTNERFDTYSEAGALDEVDRCLEQNDLDGYELVVRLSPRTDDATETTEVAEPSIAVAAPGDADLATAPLVFLDLDACDVLYVDN